MTNRPRLFIGSTTEGRAVAEAVREHLTPDIYVTLWKDPGVFDLMEHFYESLERAKYAHDFCLIILTPDDTIKYRGELIASPRDNLIFELGLFAGHLGRKRAFAFIPSDTVLKKPTDLLGITVGEYRVNDLSKGLYDVGAACNKVRRAIPTAPHTPTLELLESIIFPSLVLRYCLWRFLEFLIDPRELPIMAANAQVTITDTDGKIVQHLPESAHGYNIRSVKGSILCSTVRFQSPDHPFEAMVGTSERQGWVSFKNEGHSLIYSPMCSRNNNRLSMIHFRKTTDRIYVLECHQEISMPIQEYLDGDIRSILRSRIMEVEDELRDIRPEQFRNDAKTVFIC